MPQSRRSFLRSGLATGTLAGLGDLSFLSQLPTVSAQETSLAGGHVQLDPSIEPLVRLIEETPRNALLEEVGSRIKSGLSYRELLAALQLAGVKNVEPRPSVGFKFHSVLVVNACHLASLSSPAEHRWLPLFWALDYYKSAAQRDVEERGDWIMPAVNESALPAAHRARSAFVDAMENWDEAAADPAIASLSRTGGINEIYEQFYRLGARDFRSIGHKAIFVANSERTLQSIGRQHAEPILRSLAYALLNHDENGNPADGDAEADRPWRRNRELVQTIREDWRDGHLDRGATEELLQTLRTGTNDDVCDLVVRQINAGVSAQSVWDGLFVGAGELLMRQPGIVALHALTTTNALRYAFGASGNDETRRLVMLQNAAFLPMFRDAMFGRGRVSDRTIDDLEPEQAPEEAGEAREAIFAAVSENPGKAAQLVLSHLSDDAEQSSAMELIDAARVLVYLKGNDAHDYKFSSAVLEDFGHVSPDWRNLFLALSVHNLQGTGSRDTGLVERTRAALS